MMTRVDNNIRLLLQLLLLLPLLSAPCHAASGFVSTAVAATPIELTKEEQVWLDSHPVIRVHNEMNFPPFNVNENGQPKGYSIDYMNLLAQMLGIEVEYVSGPSWDEYLGMIKANELDVMLNIANTEERRTFINFTGSYVHSLSGIFVHKDAPAIESLEGLHGKTVAVAKGFFEQELLQRYYPQIELYLVKDALGALDAVMHGKADAVIGLPAVMRHLMLEYTITALHQTGSVDDERFDIVLNIGVRKDWSTLRNILQKAMDSLSPAEERHLKEKWLLIEEKPPVELTSEEQAWLAEHPVIRVHNELNWPPFNFYEAGKPTGYSIDYMNLIAANLGVKVEYVSGPSWDEFMQMVRDGRIDVMLNIVSTEDRRQYLAYTTPYLEMPAGIYTHKNIKNVHSLNDLAGMRVAVPKGFFYEELLRRHYPDIKLVLLEDTQQCLEAVTFGKADATVGEIGVLNYLLDKAFIVNVKLTQQIQDRRFTSVMGIAVNKRQTILRDILQKGMDAVVQEEVLALHHKWNLAVSEEREKFAQLSEDELRYLATLEEIRMCVDPDWMPLERIDKKGRHVGVAAEVMDLVRDRLPIPLRLVRTRNRAETLESARSRECDILSMAMGTPESEAYLDFSDPYLKVPMVIATTSDKRFIADMHDLKGRKVGVVGGYAVVDLLREHYPGIRLVEVDSVKDGLEKVYAGQLYGFVDALAAIAYDIEEHDMLDIKVAGRLDEQWQLGVGVRKDWPRLLTIINKVFAQIDEERIDDAYHKWIAVQMVEEFDYRVLLKYLVAVLLVVAIFVYRHLQLRRFNQRLEQIAVTDQLTGIYNRKRLDEVLACETERSARYNHGFSVIMADIDKFKEVNDTYGHQVGDQVLQNMVEIMQERVRKSDTLGRWGGEEFMVLCPGTALDGALQLAEQLRMQVASSAFPQVGQKTASFGVACYKQGDKADDVVKRADDALYAAKEGGRNRVVTEAGIA